MPKPAGKKPRPEPDPLNDMTLRVRLLRPWRDEIRGEQHEAGAEMEVEAPEARGLVHRGEALLLDADPAHAEA